MAGEVESLAIRTLTHVVGHDAGGLVSRSPLASIAPAVPVTAAGAGQFVTISTASGQGYTLPAGGTWLWQIMGYSAGTGATTTLLTGNVSAGGTAIAVGVAGTVFQGFAWRISG